jgi:hypothetical protein
MSLGTRGAPGLKPGGGEFECGPIGVKTTVGVEGMAVAILSAICDSNNLTFLSYVSPTTSVVCATAASIAAIIRVCHLSSSFSRDDTETMVERSLGPERLVVVEAFCIDLVLI